MAFNYARNSHNIPTTTRQFQPQFYPSTQNASSSMFSRNQQAVPPTPPVNQYQAAQSAWGHQPTQPTRQLARQAAVPAKECDQLNLKALMPQGWREQGPRVATEDDQNWARYAVTQEGYKQYQSAMGSIRLGTTDRVNSRTMPQRTGISCFRSDAMPKLSLGPDSVVFNDSSARQMLVSNTYKDYYGGC